MADRSGYIGRNPGDSAVIIATQVYTISGASVSDFTFTATYTVGYMDVYLNGIRLINGSDYTAETGNTVGLTSAANNGDVLELVAYKAFNLGQSIDQITGNLELNGKLTVTGISSLTDVVSSGIVTADSFYGDGSNLTGLPGQRDFWTKTAAGINTTVSVGIGTTRPDSIARVNNTSILNVGILTAYQVHVGGMTSVGDVVSSGIVTADSFYGDGSNLSGISTAAVPGISTQLHSVFGTINASGIITASQYKGDGSQLSGVGGDTDITSCLFI